MQSINAPISPAAVRLYGRAMEIECELEELLEDSMSTDELLAWLKRPYKQREVEQAKAKARRLGQHREYQWIKHELARLLDLGPDDPHPLDPKSRRKLPPNDPRWRRAMWLSVRLNEAWVDHLCWWRQPSHLRVVG